MSPLSENTVVKTTIKTYWTVIVGACTGILVAAVFFFTLKASITAQFTKQDTKLNSIGFKIDSVSLIQKIKDNNQDNAIQGTKDDLRRLAENFKSIR